MKTATKAKPKSKSTVATATAKKTTAKTNAKTTSKTSKKSDKLSTEDRKELKASDFGLPESREYPMPDAQHVHAAESYFRYASSKEKPLLAHRIMMKAKKFGVNVTSDTVKEWAKKYNN